MTINLYALAPGRRASPGTPIAKEVGERIRLLRVTHDLSQEQLGARMGVTFQQIGKYESGQNNLSVPRLLQICEIFKVDWRHFLDPRPESADTQVFAPKNRTTIEMLEAFEAISNGSHRRTLINLAQALADKQ